MLGMVLIETNEKQQLDQLPRFNTETSEDMFHVE